MMRHMKILHVITSLRTGGAEKLMVDLLPRMKECGHDVDLCVFDGTRTPFYDEIEARGVRVVALGTSVYNPLFVFKLVRLMRHYDIVHSHNTACQFYVAMAGLFTSCRIFTTEHNTTNRRRNGIWRLPDTWMYGRYERVVCISELTEQNLKAHVGDCVEHKCAVVYNGIDIEHYMSRSTDNAPSLAGKNILMVAAFRAQKDQATLIRAMALLPKDYRLRLVGGGEEALMANCKVLAHEVGVSERVEFLGVRTDVAQLLQEADVVVLSSHYEGLSLSSLEGMASGKPFVASDVEGLRDIVGGYGVLFPEGKEKELAQTIRRLCEDRDFARIVANRCVERAKLYDVRVTTQRYLALYEQIEHSRNK